MISSCCDTMVRLYNRYNAASLGLGVSRWYMASQLVLPASRRGILISMALATGRAMGETMAVMMVMGNSIGSPTLLGKGETISALIAMGMGIARALTAEQEVLLLDEPCSALDVKSTQIIEQLLLKLKETYTIVIVTHNLFQARQIADDCIFLLNGQLWEQNTTEELFNNPQKQETRDYLQGAYA